MAAAFGVPARAAVIQLSGMVRRAPAASESIYSPRRVLGLAKRIIISRRRRSTHATDIFRDMVALVEFCDVRGVQQKR
jgi:hypothetical protein